MIFVTVGTQKFQFNRLFKEIDKLIEENLIDENIFAQIGISDYIPKNFDYLRFVDGKGIQKYMEDSDIIITHSGTSSIIQVLRLQKKVLVVPRRAEFGEHVDNHQIEIAKIFEDGKFVEVAYDTENIKVKIDKLYTNDYKKFDSNNLNLLSSIQQFIKLNN